MREFLKGWRRKVGCVTLVVALIVTGAWIRSLRTADQVRIRKDSQNYYHFFSNKARASWVRVQEQFPMQFSFSSILFSRDAEAKDFFEGSDIQWRWQFCGFDFGKVITRGTNMEMEIWCIPYWPVAAPLTLLSAYLILWKPRPKVERDA